VDFLSRSTITGFMGGTATIIILQQLKGMLGMKHFTPKTDLVSVMESIFRFRHEVSDAIVPRTFLRPTAPTPDFRCLFVSVFKSKNK
jgi:MFS superfamily sulfate permease-like transporter